jgi:hypothetical protein
MKTGLKLGLFASFITGGILLLAVNFAQSLTSTTPTSLPPTATALNDPISTTNLGAWSNFYDLTFTGLNFQPTQLTFDPEHQTVVFFDQPHQQLVLLEHNQKRFRLLPTLPTATPIQAITYHQQQLLAWADALYWWQSDADTWQPLTETMVFSTATVHLASFDQNVYLIGTGLIERLNLTSKLQLNQHTTWLKQPAWLPQPPQSVWVDGYIFIAQADGTISKLQREAQNPQLLHSQPQGQVCLTGQTGTLFALMSTPPQLYQFTLEGQLLQQLALPPLANISLCYFDPQTATLYGVSETKIYSFTL